MLVRCVLFSRYLGSEYQPSLLRRDGSGRFLIWQGVGLNGDRERTVAVCEGGYEPHDVLRASRVFLWILPNAFDHSKRNFLFRYASSFPRILNKTNSFRNDVHRVVASQLENLCFYCSLNGEDATG